MGEEDTAIRKIEVMITRIDERLRNFIDNNEKILNMFEKENKEDHITIISDIKELKVHVNDEVAKMDKRIAILEQGVITIAAEKKKSNDDAKKWKIIIGAIAAGIVTILTALHSMGVF